MNIKYIKDAPNGKAGTTDKVTDFEGSLLIQLGFAQPDTTFYFDDQSMFEPANKHQSLINPKQIYSTEPTEPTEPKTKPKSKAKSTTKTDKE